MPIISSNQLENIKLPGCKIMKLEMKNERLFKLKVQIAVEHVHQ